jgi:hypothetical protein
MRADSPARGASKGATYASWRRGLVAFIRRERCAGPGGPADREGRGALCTLSGSRVKGSHSHERAGPAAPIPGRLAMSPNEPAASAAPAAEDDPRVLRAVEEYLAARQAGACLSIPRRGSHLDVFVWMRRPICGSKPGAGGREAPREAPGGSPFLLTHPAGPAVRCQRPGGPVIRAGSVGGSRPASSPPDDPAPPCAAPADPSRAQQAPFGARRVPASAAVRARPATRLPGGSVGGPAVGAGDGPGRALATPGGAAGRPGA